MKYHLSITFYDVLGNVLETQAWIRPTEDIATSMANVPAGAIRYQIEGQYKQ